jgi:hypothetical protein
MITTMTPMQEYRENEHYNAHSDNLVLMAEHVGDANDKHKASTVKSLISRHGYMTPTAGNIYVPLQAKLWPLFRNKFQGQ